MKKRKNKILYKILMPIMLLASLFMFNGVYAVDVERTISFEILTFSDGVGTVTSGTYDNFNQYFNDLNIELSLVSILVNDVSIGTPIDGYVGQQDSSTLNIFEDNIVSSIFITISNDDTFQETDYSFTLADEIEITFLVDIEPQGTIIDVLSDWVDGFTTLIISVVQSMTPIFWVESTGLTLVGMLSLMAVGIGLIYLGLRFILQLFPGSHQL